MNSKLFFFLLTYYHNCIDEMIPHSLLQTGKLKMQGLSDAEASVVSAIILIQNYKSCFL